MDPEEIKEEEEEERLPLTGPQVAQSAGTEVVAGVGGEIAASLLKGRLSLFRPAVRFISGAVGSLTAQTAFEDKKGVKGLMTKDDPTDIELGRVLAAGVANSFAFKNRGVSPVRDATIRGAGLAAGERTLGDYLDTGEVKVEDIAIAGATGGGLGNILGRVDAKYFSTAHALAGKRADEIDELIATDRLDNKTVSEILEPVLGKEATQRQILKTKDRLQREFIANDIASGEKGILGPFRSTFKKAMNYIAPAKRVGAGSREGYYKFQNEMQRAEALSTKLEASITQATLRNEALRDDITDFMNGGEMTERLAKDAIAGDLHESRNIEMTAIKRLYKSFEENDELSLLPKEAREVVMDRMQQEIDRGHRMYDTSVYKAFVDKKWSDNAERRAAAIEEVRSSVTRKRKEQGQDISDPKIETKINAEVDSHFKHLESMFAKDSRMDQKALIATLPGRFEIKIKDHMPGPAERAFLGEVTAGVQRAGFQSKYRIRDSIRHQAKIESNISVLKAVQSTNQVRYTKEPGYTEFNLPGMAGIDADGRQMYLPAETAHAISKLYEAEFTEQMVEGTAGFVNKVGGSLVAYSKAAKVIYNPASYMVNGIGGVMAALGNGVNIFRRSDGRFDYGKGFALASAEVGDIKKATKLATAESRQKLIADLNEMYEYGIGNASIAASEVAAALKNGQVGGTLSRLTQTMGKVYNVTDSATRYTIWKSNQDFLKGLQKKGVSFGANAEEATQAIKRIAATITNDTYQNYQRTSRLGKYLSRRGILPPFVTFTLEFFRNTVNQVRFAGKMARGESFLKDFDLELPQEGANKVLNALRAEGAKRYGALGAALAVSAGAGSLMAPTFKFVFDGAAGDPLEGSKEKDDFAFFGFSYMRDKDFAATLDKETKKGTFAMTSYLFPHATVTQFMSALYDSVVDGTENQYETTKTLSGLITEELMGEGTFVNQNVMRAVDNRDIYGEKISTAEGYESMKERLSYAIGKTFEPGVMREGLKFADAIQGQGDYTFGEVLMRQAGARLTKIDFNQMAIRRVQDFSERYSDARGNYTTDYKYKFLENKISEDDINRSYNKSIESAEAAFSRIEEAYSRLDSLGYSVDEKIEVLKRGNVRSADIFRIARGMPFKPFAKGVVESTQEKYDARVGGKTEQESKTYIKRMSKSPDRSDRVLAEKFFAEFNRRKDNVRRDRTKLDLLLLNLNAADRAALIIEMGHHTDPKLVHQYKRKGIISVGVNDILRASR